MSEAPLSDVAFVAIFTLVPLLMLGTLVCFAGLRVHSELAFHRALRRGWARLDEGELRARLRGLPAVELPRARLSRCARRATAGSWCTCVFSWRQVGMANQQRQGRSEAWLIVPARPGAELPHAVITRRGSGALERVSLAIAQGLGARELKLPEAWLGLRVSGPRDAAWFTSARGARCLAALAPGEALYLNGDSAVLSVPSRRYARLMQQADARAEALLAALA